VKTENLLYLIFLLIIIIIGLYMMFSSEEVKSLVCINESIGAYTFIPNDSDVYCVLNDTLTQKAIELEYPYTIYSCVVEECEVKRSEKQQIKRC